MKSNGNRKNYKLIKIIEGIALLSLIAVATWWVGVGWLHNQKRNIDSEANLNSAIPTDIPISPVFPLPTPTPAPIVLPTQPPTPTSTLISSNWLAEDKTLNITRYFSNAIETAELVFPDGAKRASPSHLVISNDNLYILAGGILYQTRFSTPLPTQLHLTSVMPFNNEIGNVSIREPFDLALGQAGGLYLLDKSNDVYKYMPEQGWSVDLAASPYPEIPDPHYVAIATYNNRRYLLDIARNQIWRHPGAGDYAPQYFLEVLPWLLQPGDPDVTQGISLAIDGRVFILTESGVRRFESAKISHGFEITPTIPSPSSTNLSPHLMQPFEIFLPDERPDEILVADGSAPRVVVLDRETGKYKHQYLFYTPQHTGQIQDLVVLQDHLYALSGRYLMRVNLANLPPEAVFPSGRITLPTPDPLIDQRVLAYLQTFVFPIENAYLPDRLSVFPGARRVYRYGVHEGLDIYSYDQDEEDAEITLGYPVQAAADGVIIRADVAYQEMSSTEYEDLIAQTEDLHITPENLKDKLRGRQVWVQHNYDVTTRYAHLSQIADGFTAGTSVKKGQIIGYVGGSGTTSGIYQTNQYPHLHFEIRTGDDYLGRGLTLIETRRLWREIFTEFVKPRSDLK